MDIQPRKSKQQASQNILSQSRKRQRDLDDVSADESSSSILPVSVYGVYSFIPEVDQPEVVQRRDLIRNAFLNTISDMYFGTTDPFPEILRSLDDRVDPHTHRYVSGLIAAIKSEMQEATTSNKKLAKEKVIVTPLDMLACPFRKPHAIDTWTPYDIALFELGVCENKGFHAKKLHALFEGKKAIDEIQSFFEHVYSKSENYQRIVRAIGGPYANDDSDEYLSSEDMQSVSNPDSR